MDLYCCKCGEPFDQDELHEIAVELKTSYKAIGRKFRAVGCSALEYKCTPRESGPMGHRAQAAAALYDVLGDDMDGCAAELSDLEWGGEFDVEPKEQAPSAISGVRDIEWVITGESGVEL